MSYFYLPGHPGPPTNLWGEKNPTSRAAFGRSEGLKSIFVCAETAAKSQHVIPP